MIDGENKYFTTIRCKDNEAWLKQRTRGIGGSDTAAITGTSKYRSAYTVYMEKIGKVKPADLSDKQAVQWGNILEPIVGEEYKRRHPKREVRRVNAVLRSIERPWAQASLDYEVKDEELGWGVLEIKTAGLMRAADWENGIPDYYVTQIAHYLSITKREFADVAVLIGGQEYREYRYMRDIPYEQKLTRAVDDFYHNSIVGGEVPPITDKASDTFTVLNTNEPHTGEVVDYTDDLDPFKRYLQAREAKEEAEKAYKQAGNEIRKIIGDAKGVKTALGRFTWTRSECKRFDMKRFTSEHEQLKEQYMTKYTRDSGIRVSEE